MRGNDQTERHETALYATDQYATIPRTLALALGLALLTLAPAASAGLPISVDEAQRQQAQQQDDNPYTGPSDSMLNSQIQLYDHEYPPNLRQQREDQYDRDLWRLYLQNHWNDRR